MRKWPKLTLVAHTASHLIAAAVLSTGPRQDSPLFEPAMVRASWHLDVDRLLADGGYDSEANHRVAREGPGVRSTVINLNRRGKGAGRRPSPRKWAKTRYRRQMYRRFHRRKYGQRVAGRERHLPVQAATRLGAPRAQRHEQGAGERVARVHP